MCLAVKNVLVNVFTHIKHPSLMFSPEKEKSWWLSYLNFQRVCIIRTWCEVSVHFGSATERPTVRDFIIEPEAIPVACSIGAAGHSTLKRFKWKLRSPALTVQTFHFVCQQRGRFLKAQNHKEHTSHGFDTFQAKYMQKTIL